MKVYYQEGGRRMEQLLKMLDVALGVNEHATCSYTDALAVLGKIEKYVGLDETKFLRELLISDAEYWRVSEAEAWLQQEIASWYELDDNRYLVH